MTGAARGMGAAIAKRLIEDGYQVIGVDIEYSQTLAEAQPVDTPMQEIAVDLVNKAEIDVLVRWIYASYQRLDLLVNNAMWIHYDSLANFREEDIDRMLAVGFKAPLWLAQATAPMLEASSGSIVNISSASAVVGIPGSIGYGSIKGAIAAMTRHLAVELAPKGVRVNSVAPGYSPTPGVAKAVSRDGETKRIARTPLARLCEPEDVASAVSYLASSEASFITGQSIGVDGGMTITM